MTTRRTLLAILLLIVATLACSVLGEEAQPAPTATVEPTPTLAPTATIDPAVTPLGQGLGEPTADPSQPGSEETPTSEQATAEPDSGEGNDNQAAGGDQSGGDQAGGDQTTGDQTGGDQTGNGQTAVACPAPGQNLLLNPSFEGEYKPFGAFKELNHAPNWFPWWQDGQNNLRPEFKPAEASTAANRVHSGSRAQQYFKSFGQFKAGVYQPVLNITPGTRLQFSIFGQAWSCENNDLCPGSTSVNPANMLMRVGIDPTGNTDWSSNTVVWSPYFNPLDQWQLACVEAVADAEKVTVFVWASPDGPRQNQDAYWDDANLVALP